MTRFLSSLALMLVAISATACYKDSPWYCEDQPNSHCGNKDGFPCQSREDCSGQEGKSCTEPDDDGFGICVQCTPADATSCAATTPVCGTDNLCRACSEHPDCSSAVCLDDGSCASEATIAYVAPNGTGTACSKATPCGTMAAAVTTGKASIKVATGLVKSNQATIIDGKAVTIFAEEGAKLDRDGDGAVLEVRSAGADVKIFDLEITGATGSSGANGIEVDPNGGSPKLALTRVKLTGNQGLGLQVQGGAVTVSQSTISGNTGGGVTSTGGTLAVSQSRVAGNSGGGILVSAGTFNIVNSFLYANGGLGTTVGGISISTTQDSSNRFEFNTLSRNGAQDSIGAGIQCVAGTFVARNNIVYGNGTVSNPLQIAGSCSHVYSDIGPMAAGAGTGNINMDPLFLNIATGDLHISALSPVRGAADPTASLSPATEIDIDGEARSLPADIGADEVP